MARVRCPGDHRGGGGPSLPAFTARPLLTQLCPFTLALALALTFASPQTPTQPQPNLNQVGHPLVRGSRATVRLGSVPRAAPPYTSANTTLPGSSMSASIGTCGAAHGASCGGAAGAAESADGGAVAAAARPAATVTVAAAAAAPAAAVAGGPVHMTRYVRLFWPSTLHAAYRTPFGEGIHAGLISTDGEELLEPLSSKVLRGGPLVPALSTWMPSMRGESKADLEQHDQARHSLVLPASPLTLHSSPPIPHPAPFTPHPPFLTLHPSLRTPRPAPCHPQPAPRTRLTPAPPRQALNRLTFWRRDIEELSFERRGVVGELWGSLEVLLDCGEPVVRVRP